jgi:hypothetical protein
MVTEGTAGGLTFFDADLPFYDRPPVVVDRQILDA